MDPLTSLVLFLHKVFIFCGSYIFTFNFYIILTIILPIFGIMNLNPFGGIFILSTLAFWIFGLFNLICVHIFTILFILLLWIFIFWMIIIIFVPYIIIFPIPIIPFFFILPLKPILLALPPFITLTDTGTLQLVYKILSRFFNYRTFEHFISYFLNPTFIDLKDYFSYNTKQLIDEIFYYLTGHNFDYYDFLNTVDDNNNNNNNNQDGRTKEMVDDGLETNDNKDDNDKYNEIKNTPKIKGGMEKIQEDTDLCVNMSQKFKLYNSSATDDISTDMDNSISPYKKCYINAIKSYLKTSIN